MKNPLNLEAKMFLDFYRKNSPYSNLGVVNDKSSYRLYFVAGTISGWMSGNIGSYEYKDVGSSKGFYQLESGEPVKVYRIEDLIEKTEIEPAEGDWESF